LMPLLSARGPMPRKKALGPPCVTTQREHQKAAPRRARCHMHHPELGGPNFYKSVSYN
jgi:hypothetical protein